MGHPITAFANGRGQVSRPVRTVFGGGFANRLGPGSQDFYTALGAGSHQITVVITGIQQDGSHQSGQVTHTPVPDVTLTSTPSDRSAQTHTHPPRWSLSLLSHRP